MSEGARLGAGFTDVDRSEYAQIMVAAMDQTAAWPATRALRGHNDAWLGLSPGQALLDVGCGPGVALLALAEQVMPGGRAVGLDNSTVMIAEATRRAAERGLAVTVVQGDACALDFDDGTFDACRSERTLQWIADPGLAIAEMARVVRPGGRIGIIDSDWGTVLLDHPDQELTRRVFEGVFAASPNSRCGRRLVGLCRAAGLVEVDVAAETALFTQWNPDHGPVPGLPPFEIMLELAEGAGVITQEEGKGWLGTLTSAARQGHFFAGLTMFSVTARTAA